MYYVGAVVEVNVGSNNILFELYSQDAYMIENYMIFPEMLFTDATHNLGCLYMFYWWKMGMVKARLCHYA